MVIKKDKLRTFNITSILIQCLDDKFVTQKRHVCYSSQMFENPTINLNTLRNSLARRRVVRLS
jgi:hypothetical protein